MMRSIAAVCFALALATRAGAQAPPEPCQCVIVSATALCPPTIEVGESLSVSVTFVTNGLCPEGVVGTAFIAGFKKSGKDVKPITPTDSSTDPQGVLSFDIPAEFIAQVGPGGIIKIVFIIKGPAPNCPPFEVKCEIMVVKPEPPEDPPEPPK